MPSLPLSLVSTLILTLALSLFSCADSTPRAEPLRVGTTPNYAPLTFERDGELTGIEIEFAQRLGQDLGRPVEIIRLAWTDLIPALDERRVDVVMSGTSITEARAERVLFAAPYMKTGQMVLVRQGDIDEPRALDSPDVRVGFERLTTGAAFVRSHLSRAQSRAFDDVDVAAAAVRSGEIDAFVHDAPTIWRLTGRPLEGDAELAGLYVPLTHEQLAWAVRLGNEALKRDLDRVLAQWRESGWLDEVLLRWIPVRRQTLG